MPRGSRSRRCLRPAGAKDARSSAEAFSPTLVALAPSCSNDPATVAPDRLAAYDDEDFETDQCALSVRASEDAPPAFPLS
jgi:hypothetical protein